MYSQSVVRINQLDQQKKTRLPSRSKKQTQSQLNPILQLQQTMGNQAFARMIQAKLTIGQRGDKYEQEADRVAEEVVRMSDPQTKLGVTVSNQPQISRIQRTCSECEEEIQRQSVEEEEEPLQSPPPEGREEEAVQSPQTGKLDIQLLRAKKKDGGLTKVSRNVQSQIDNLKSEGHPLPESIRASFEPRFGYDFSDVRVHANGRAAELARKVNARAFTVGSDVVFGAGEFIPGTSEGKKLLAHELTHVVQQDPSSTLTESSKQGTKTVKIQAKIDRSRILQRWSVDGPADPASNTIVCNGAGDIAVLAGATGNDQQTACLRDCIVEHERSHIVDALDANRNLCRDKAANSQVLFGPGEQAPSERRASNVEINCLNEKLRIPNVECSDIINARIRQMEQYRDGF